MGRRARYARHDEHRNLDRIFSMLRPGSMGGCPPCMRTTRGANVRRWTKWGAAALVVPAMWLGACGDDTSSGEDDGGAGGGNTPPPGDQIDLLADTNRDGLVDTFDNAGEELW